MKRLQLLFVVILMLSHTACGVYSFTGASIPAGAKTVSIQYFPNNAMLVEPTLSIDFTSALRDKFMSLTNLNLIDKNGDLAFEGEIIDFKILPIAIQKDQTADQNRLTITINVRFFNKLDPTKDFETKFTQYKDYSSNQDFNSAKLIVIPEILELLVDDVFSKSVVNW